MKKPKHSASSTSGLLTNESNSLSHSLSSQNDAFPHAPPQPSETAQRFELEERDKAVDDGGDDGGDDGEDGEGYGDEDDVDDVEGDEVEEREGERVEKVDDEVTMAEKLITRQKLAEGFFEVEAIRKKRIHKGEPLYLIKWRGWPESANTWEPVDHLQTCPDVIEAYEERLQSGQKKNSSKRKRKFTPLKKKMQYPYGATKSKISSVKMSLSSERNDTGALGIPKNAHSQPDMVDIIVKHDETVKRPRTLKKVDRNGSRTVFPSVGNSEKDRSESVQLSDQNASERNSDVHLQQPGHAEGDGPANQMSKSTRVEAAQNNQRRGAQRRKPSSVRRFKQDIASFNVDCFGTPLPLNASTSEGVEQLIVDSSDVTRKKRSDSSRSTTVTKIIKPISYAASVTNNVQDVSVTFVVMRSDGKEVMVDNKYLKATNPLLLINFYEQHLRYNPT
ncbi:hypothetical protein RND81_02G099300 [Saponaria officinalis]|uniref:Chromo domain-containing protein n=1 Tax=Saponaria officinalis TaxID=3572 RepID=A0AAW1MNV8_SAPOF